MILEIKDIKIDITLLVHDFRNIYTRNIDHQIQALRIIAVFVEKFVKLLLFTKHLCDYRNTVTDISSKNFNSWKFYLFITLVTTSCEQRQDI